RVLARIARAAHPPHIETGIGPSETKAERPATEKGFWNRIDATARCRAVEERDEATRGEQSPGKPDPEPLRPRRRKVGQAGLPARCRGWARPSGQTGPLEAPGRKTGLGTAGRRGPVFGPGSAPDGTGAGASAGR